MKYIPKSNADLETINLAKNDEQLLSKLINYWNKLYNDILGNTLK